MAPPAHSGYGDAGAAAAPSTGASAADVAPPPSSANRSDAGTVVTPPPSDDVPSTATPPAGDDRPFETEQPPTEAADGRVASPPGRGIGPVARPPPNGVAATETAATPSHGYCSGGFLAPNDAELASDFWPASSCVADPADVAPPLPSASSSTTPPRDRDGAAFLASDAGIEQLAMEFADELGAESPALGIGATDKSMQNVAEPEVALDAPDTAPRHCSMAGQEGKFVDIRPAPEDVLFGTDAITRSHPGTSHLRVILDAVQESYDSLEPTHTRHEFVSGFVGHVHSQGGRFLKRDAARGGAWREVADAEARSLIMNRWRESSTKIHPAVDPANRTRIEARTVHAAHPPPPRTVQFRKERRTKERRTVHSEPIVLRKKFSWRNYPELEEYLLANRTNYLRHSALNYTHEQKHFNNRLTEGLLELAATLNYVFDETCFNFIAVRDRIRSYYKSQAQCAKKRGVVVGFGEEKSPKRVAVENGVRGDTD